MTIRPYRARDRKAVVALWRTCRLVRPWNDPHQDIRRKLRVNPEWFLVGESGGKIIGSVMAGYEGHRGWINYLAVAAARRRGGRGRALMDEAERLLRAAGCAKINLQVRAGNTGVLAFYRKLGYRVDDCISLGKRLEND